MEIEELLNRVSNGLAGQQEAEEIARLLPYWRPVETPPMPLEDVLVIYMTDDGWEQDQGYMRPDGTWRLTGSEEYPIKVARWMPHAPLPPELQAKESENEEPEAETA